MKRKLQTVFHYLKSAIWDDWRGTIVVGGVILSGIVTILIYKYSSSATKVDSFFGAAFASWVGGYILFIITGLIITIVTLSRPDQEIFESRARNLLQKQTGPHINYIVGKLHALFEAYLDEVIRKLYIVNYDEKLKMFYVHQETEMIYRSYLIDIPVTFYSKIGYINGTPSQDGQQKCCLSYLKVCGEEIGEPEEFDDSVMRDFEIQVLPQVPAKVSYRLSFWIRESEEKNRQKIVRFTRKFQVSVINQLTKEKIAIRHPNDQNANCIISPAQEVKIINILETAPTQNDEDFAFDFRLEMA